MSRHAEICLRFHGIRTRKHPHSSVEKKDYSHVPTLDDEHGLIAAMTKKNSRSIGQRLQLRCIGLGQSTATEEAAATSPSPTWQPLAAEVGASETRPVSDPELHSNVPIHRRLSRVRWRPRRAVRRCREVDGRRRRQSARRESPPELTARRRKRGLRSTRDSTSASWSSSSFASSSLPPTS